MKNGKRRIAVLLFSVMLSICCAAGAVSLAQSREGFITEGVSLDNIVLGRSTTNDVISVYGNDYKLVNHKDYSYEMIYKKHGLSFYACQADPNKEIFVIEIQSPAKVTTSKGIILGESTMADVLRIYGETEDFEYENEGIYFKHDEQSDEEVDDDEESETKAEFSDENNQIKNPSPGTTESTFIIDNEEVVNIRSGSLNQSNNLAVNENNVGSNNAIGKNSDDSTLNHREDKKGKNKIVKYIELIEKSGLRQCDSKFPRTKNK